MHTKGPWKAVGSFVVADASNAPEGCNETDLEAYGGYLIAESIFHPPNQALIAAATELLEALDGFTQFIELMGMKVPRDVKHIIAKAKGENDE